MSAVRYAGVISAHLAPCTPKLLSSDARYGNLLFSKPPYFTESQLTTAVSKQKFTCAPSIIMSLIKAQAGSLAKAILECVQNSVDAGATSITIDTREGGVLIQDDGRGFKDRGEVDEYFSVFGFDHSGLDRVYGQFGIGRAQLWAFASTVWRTNSFEMRVDVKNHGLDYDLLENLPPVAGVRIEAVFYEPMRTLDLLEFDREFKELAAYAQVPVVLNGVTINKNPAAGKWTHETDDAWILVSPSARYLSVYNLGVKVRDYSSHQFGLGGVVVTKPGVRLQLNMARNDVLVAACGVWRRIKPFLQQKADEAVKRSPKLTEEQLSNIATRFLARALPYSELHKQKLIVDALGGKHTIDRFLTLAHATSDKTVTCVEQGETTPVAESSHRNKHCFVMSTLTLARFGTRTVGEFMTALLAVIDAAPRSPLTRRFGSNGYEGTLRICEDWRDACTATRDGYAEVPEKDWTKRECAAMVALEAANQFLPGIVCGMNEHNDPCVLPRRRLLVGESAVALAWTDGKTRVCFDRKILAWLHDGLSGVLALVHVMIHEYLHDCATDGSHIHDLEFYQRFEAVVCSGSNSPGSRRDMGAAVQAALTAYLRECARIGLSLPKSAGRAVDACERVAELA